MLHLLSDTENLNHAVAESIYLTRFKKFLEYRASKFEPKYFVTCYYGRSYEGGYLTPDAYRKRWDRNEVRKTHKFIRGQIRKYLGDVPMVFVIERHKETVHPVWGEMKGAFHTHLYLGDVNKSLAEHYSMGVVDEGLHELQLEELSLYPHMHDLLNQKDYFGCSINSGRRQDANLTELLIEYSIRQSKWVGKFPDSLDIQKIRSNAFGLDFKRTFHYGLKQIDKEDDLNEVIDWKNSDFQKNGTTNP